MLCNFDGLTSGETVRRRFPDFSSFWRVMKNLLIAFLLAIFSVQGIVVAMRDDITGHVQAPATNPVADLSSSCCSGDEAEPPQVFVTIEELSDYVPFDLPVSDGPNQVAESSSLPVFLLSTDLPRIKPPPRV